ncbi:unnamed protein product [Acanthoscelides obtectus]|uniref:Uncharacterized protein n=1 Tax=Acanthoscelides obtectus TaxID=200917 RepID=A0A9P0L7U2_ACAOB|nr:unnamed protein product [Acanthoscelides obtectus]CAK1674031.1 hypothetical protein AOBTE_LOCUS29505 [Acanthoscelides obtectus]
MINYLLEKLSKPKKYFGHAKNLRYNKVYQYYVEVILVKCIQHHQFLVRYVVASPWLFCYIILPHGFQ